MVAVTAGLFTGKSFGTLTIGSTTFTDEVRSFTIKDGQRELEHVRTFGSGGNSYMFDKPMGLITTEMEVVVKDVDMAQFWMGGSAYGGGSVNLLTGDALRTMFPRIVINLVDPVISDGANIRFVQGSALCNMSDIKLEQDGYLQATFSATCVPHLFRMDYTGSATTTPLTSAI